MTDHEQLETMLRSSLTERAGDVDATPALYERVQRQATRGTWLRHGVALAGAAAVVAVAVTAVPALLPDQPLRPDVADTPDAVEPTEPSVDPSVDEDTGPSDGAVTFAAAMAEAGVAWSDGETIHIGDRQVGATVLIEDGTAADAAMARATALAVEPGPASDDRHVAAVMRSDAGVTSIGWTRIGGMDGIDPAHFDGIAAGAPNGDGITFIPGDMAALAWIEGTDLHLLSLDGSFDRVMPLEGDVPDDLVAQQWVAQADAQVLFASDPGGGLWSLPMDDSNAANTGPTDPGFQLAGTEAAVDGLLRPDLARVDLEVSPDGSAPARLRAGGASPIPLPGDLASSTAVRLIGNGSWLVAVNDPVSGEGALLHLDDTGRYMPTYLWGDHETPVTAVAPLRLEDAPSSPVDLSEDASADDAVEADAVALGLPTDAPVVGTAGTDLLVRTANGQVQTIAVYPAESEATLGRLAVRPGSTLQDGMVAVESFSEGENSVRFVALRDGTATPVGNILVTDGPVTGLVWSEDGGEIAFTDTMTLHYGSVDRDGTVAGSGEVLSRDARPVLDWTWTEVADDATGGILTVAVNGGTGVEHLEVGRDADGVVRLLGPVGGADRVVLDTHASPGAAAGPEVIAQLGGGTAVLTWSADGDRSGELPDPGQLGGDVRVEVSGGQVLVMGASRQVLVTFDGEVLDLPTAADWDVLD